MQVYFSYGKSVSIFALLLYFVFLGYLIKILLKVLIKILNISLCIVQLKKAHTYCIVTG